MKTYKSMRTFVFAGLILALLLTVSGVFAATNVHEYSGLIASGPQYDLYQENLVAGSRVTATTFCATALPTLDTILTVYLPGNDASDTGDSFVYNDDGGSQACGGFRNSTFSFVVPQTGAYLFRVDGFGSSTGGYSLVISIEDGGNPMAADGRINPQQAAPIILYCDGTTLNGFSVDGAPLFSMANGDTGSGAGWWVGTAPDGRMLVTGAFPDGKAYNFAFDGCPHGNYDAFAGDPPQVFDSGSY